MRVLMFTQAVDRKDSALGVFHRWIEELSRRVDHVIVCTLRTGEMNLPGNVTVVPLRPWGYRSTVRTVYRVLVEVWRRRREYDTVFVHMNQEYLLVAGWLLWLMGKKIFFWRNHYEGNLLTDVASLFPHRIFCTSKSSFTAKYKKTKIMPVGVDVGSCNQDEPIERVPGSILFLARFDISKRPHLLVEALSRLRDKGVSFTASFVGGPSDPSSEYPAMVEKMAYEAGISGIVQFVGPVPNTETYRYYRSHDIYVNCAQSGMLDKTIFKALACGCYALSASKDMAEIAGEEFVYTYDDVENLALHLERALSLSLEEKRNIVSRLQKDVVAAHALPVLMDRLVAEMSV